MTRHPLRRLAPAAGLLALAACAPPGTGPTGSVALPEQRYQVTATVLQRDGSTPQLCAAVAESYPPQCGGPEIINWNWSVVESESASGTTWGEYVLVGTWDGERFTVTGPARPATASDYEVRPVDFSTPCPEPPGGWRPVDRVRATSDTMYATLTRAESAPDYAGAWLDQSYLDELGIGADDPRREQVSNDATRLVLNLRFTGDLPARERWIREMWGGALCLSGAERTYQELLELQRRVHEEEDLRVLSSGPDVLANALRVQVFVATDELRHELDRRFGPGAVILDGWLRPVS
jgi:hypothetical protein